MFQCKYISIKGVNETSKKPDDGFGTVNEHNYKYVLKENIPPTMDPQIIINKNQLHSRQAGAQHYFTVDCSRGRGTHLCPRS